MAGWWPTHRPEQLEKVRAGYGPPAILLPCNAADNGEATFWLGVIAFGKQADALVKHEKCDLMSMMGNMQIN